jgi:thiol-disulfide isomerase/thioredoxin
MPNPTGGEADGRQTTRPPRSWSWYSVAPPAVLSLIIAAVWLSAVFSSPSSPIAPPTSAELNRNIAPVTGPAAADIAGIAEWINSEPLTLSDLRGNVVLLDFWTYTCVNCIRTFPHLKRWHDQYADDGLVVLGIHTPEFEFEKDPTNVRQATKDYGITWPVALDNDYVTWDNYQNIFWPAKYLIDQEGRVRHQQIGEGGYATAEEHIRQLLEEAGADLSDDPQAPLPDHLPDVKFEAAPDAEVTRELYAGYERGAFELQYYGQGYTDQLDYYRLSGETLRLVAPEYLQPNLIYFHGLWSSEPQKARHARQTTDFEDYVALVFSARSVNAVLTTEAGEEHKVRVTMDGKYLTEENRGEDVIIGADGESYLWIDESRMYRVVENPNYAQRKTLRLSANSDRFGLYAFTFGIYQDGP